MSTVPPLSPGSRARAVRESVTLAISAKAQELRAAGKDVISLSAGEPDFPTPPAVRQAGAEAIEAGHTRYTAAAGLPALREAATRWVHAEFGLSYRPDELMVTAGAKAGLHMGLSAIVEPGDRVLLPAPYWVSYPDLVGVSGGEIISLPPEPAQGFIHTGAQVDEAARRHGARGIVLNFPNNPSGAVPTRAQMGEIVDAAVANGMWIVSDEIYGTLIYDGREHVSPASFEAARERTLVVVGATKSHSFTGWRLAFLAGPAELVAAAGRIQSQVLGNPCSISQHAALAVCEGDFTEEKAMRLRSFDERRRFLVEEFSTMDGLDLTPPDGAFYALVDARGLCEQRGIDDVALSEQLLEDVLVAVVPGSAFAIPGFIRLSYASAMDSLRRAVERLRSFLG